MNRTSVFAFVLLALVTSCASQAPERVDEAPIVTFRGEDEPGPARQSMLFYTASGSSEPHRAVLTLDFAVTAGEAKHDVRIFLAGEAVLLMKDSIAADVKAVGQPVAADLLRKAKDLRIPIFV